MFVGCRLSAERLRVVDEAHRIIGRCLDYGRNHEMPFLDPLRYVRSHSNPSVPNSGQTVLITGARGAIGRALALEFARQGARLVLCDLTASFRIAWAALGLAIALPIIGVGVVAAENRPNILVVISDDQSWLHTS